MKRSLHHWHNLSVTKTIFNLIMQQIHKNACVCVITTRGLFKPNSVKFHLCIIISYKDLLLLDVPTDDVLSYTSAHDCFVFSIRKKWN